MSSVGFIWLPSIGGMLGLLMLMILLSLPITTLINALQHNNLLQLALQIQQNNYKMFFMIIATALCFIL